MPNDIPWFTCSNSVTGLQENSTENTRTTLLLGKSVFTQSHDSVLCICMENHVHSLLKFLHKPDGTV